MKILLADDEPIYRTAIEKYFKKQNIEVKSVVDGLSAIDELKKNEYDLVLLDYMMPGKTGADVVEWMKENNDHTPVILISALSDAKLIENVTGGVRLFLPKNAVTIESLPNFVKTITLVSKYI